MGCHNLYRPWVQYPGSDKRVLAKTEWFHRLGESSPFLYVYPLFCVFASPYTIYAEGVDHPKPQVREKKVVAFLDTLLYEVFLKLHPRVLSLWCRLGRLNQGDLNLGELLSDQFPLGRLGFKQEGAGKLRIFAIPNAFKQALIRPAHDWCMEVLRRIPTDGTFNQTAPLARLSRLDHLDLSAATDRFPLPFQETVVKSLFFRAFSLAWLFSRLGRNMFQAPSDSRKGTKTVCFNSGQPLGYLSSWPLFSLCHHFLVWCAAEDVYPDRRFLDYALLGDDIVIGDQKVALRYKQWLADLGVSVSMRSQISALAKKFCVKGVDLSPINIQMS